jgi:hypothetical protein
MERVIKILAESVDDRGVKYNKECFEMLTER